ncbi:MAG: class I SAM-dependent methyltransferase [bacterium]
MTSTSRLRTVKGVYVAGARATGRALTRVGLLPDVAPSRDHRLRHWAYSLPRAYDSLAIAQLDVPWWTYRAIDYVDAWLDARPHPVRVFEYGSGASTLWLARRADEVNTVEHDPDFAEHIASTLGQHGNIAVRVVEAHPAAAPRIASAKEGHAHLDFYAYVHSIEDVAGRFDVIVIDGRAREACLETALPRLAPDGIIVFDNTGRARYRRAIEAAPVHERRLRGLTPTLPYPDQTSILTARH